nr:hypothetical protein [uncultured Marvinbryantia sp.]
MGKQKASEKAVKLVTGIFVEPSDEWKKKTVENKYFSDSQRFWHKAIANQIRWAEIDILEEIREATVIVTTTVAAITTICMMLYGILGYLNKR